MCYNRKCDTCWSIICRRWAGPEALYRYNGRAATSPVIPLMNCSAGNSDINYSRTITARALHDYDSQLIYLWDNNPCWQPDPRRVRVAFSTSTTADMSASALLFTFLQVKSEKTVFFQYGTLILAFSGENILRLYHWKIFLCILAISVHIILQNTKRSRLEPLPIINCHNLNTIFDGNTIQYV